MASQQGRKIETEYPRITSKKIMDETFRAIMISAYKDSKELRPAALAGYRKRFNSNMPEDLMGEMDVATLFLMGPPGQGKTSCVRQGAKDAAKALGLNFVTSSDLSRMSRIPNKKDFVFSVHSLGGEISSVSLTGLPSRRTIGTESPMEYTGNIKNKMYAEISTALSAGGYGLMFYDDVGNGAAHIITALYDVIEERSMHGEAMPPCILASNYGQKDGNKSTYIPAALQNRVRMHHYDMVGEENVLLDRLQDKIEKYRDAGAPRVVLSHLTAIVSYFDMNKQNIVPDPKTGRVLEAQATPRSIEKMFNEILVDGCNIFASQSDAKRSDGYRSAGYEKMMEYVDLEARAFCGNEIAYSLSAYVSSYMDDITPMVERVFEGMSPDEYNAYLKKITPRLNGGIDGQGLHLGAQLCYAAADVAFYKIDTSLERDDLMESAREAYKLMYMAVAPATPHNKAISLHRVFNRLIKNMDFVEKCTHHTKIKDTNEIDNIIPHIDYVVKSIKQGFLDGGCSPGEISRMRGEISRTAEINGLDGIAGEPDNAMGM